MAATTDLIGRDAEIRLVAERLADRRLVTIVGPGGIGKTALARAAATRAEGRFSSTLRADLTLVDDAAGVHESIAGQFGYSSFAALLDAPGDHPVLLLVDNCEHVLDAATDAIATLLDACDMPTVLTTSRAALDVPGEVVIPLGPLQLPPAGVIDGPAVALFVERAREAGVTISGSGSVAELVRRLDGVPLAIELAAARTRSMTPDEVLARLTEGLDVLYRPRRRSPQRHRSIRAAIDWSVDLLDPPARRLFAGLSVFAGPFTFESAHAVAAEPTATPAQTQDLLDDLVAWSMVVADTTGTVARYRLLEAMRSVGHQLLDSDRRRHQLEARFVDHVVDRAAVIVEQGSSTWSSGALADLYALYGNIASAVRWCLANDDRPDRSLLLVAVLWGLVHQAHTEEIGDLADQVIARWPSSDHPLWADAAATAATCRYMLGDHETAVALATSSLGAADRSPFAPATLRRAIAQSLRATGDTAGALDRFAEAAHQARRLGLVSMATEADSARAQILADLDHHEQALATVEVARREAEAAGSEVGATWARVIRGSILLRTDPDRAAVELAAALDAARAIGYDAGVSVALRSLALAELLRGDALAAAHRARDLLADLLARGSTYELRLVLDVTAVVLARSGRPGPAADLVATALSLPVVSITASVGHEILPLDPVGGQVLSTRDAIAVARAELAAVLGQAAIPSPPVPAPSSSPASSTASAASSSSTPASSAPSPSPTGVFRRRGDSWEVGLRGELVTVRSSKGMVDIATLLRSPHRELHCLDLVGAGVVEGHTGDVIDAAARRAYEGRVRQLQAELDEAEAANDRGRLERARRELDAVVDQLTEALGLGGTTRTRGATAERARSAVTQRIRATIRRLDVLHPRLGRHLDASIRTGTFCAYHPETPIDWDL